MINQKPLKFIRGFCIFDKQEGIDKARGKKKPRTEEEPSKPKPPKKPEKPSPAEKQQEAIKKTLQECDKVRKTKGNTDMFNKNGGSQQALKDFNSLKLKNVRKIKNGGIVGQLENGEYVNIHKSSMDKGHRWTLELGKKKIRYS